MRKKIKSISFYMILLFVVEYLVIKQVMLEGFSSIRMILTGIFGVLMFFGVSVIVYIKFKVDKDRKT